MIELAQICDFKKEEVGLWVYENFFRCFLSYFFPYLFK